MAVTMKDIARVTGLGLATISKYYNGGSVRAKNQKLIEETPSPAVSDEQMAHAAERFPINPPMNKEEYCYRSIFEEHFPSESAARSVPSVPSVACSSAVALEWDASFKNLNDPSGRAVAGVHNEAYVSAE